MKEFVITAYEFKDLSDDAKENAIRKYRESDYEYPDYDWWDYTYEYWQEELEKLGYTDAKIQFSGFYSQGDGASFTCGIDSDILVSRLFNDEEKELVKGCIFYGSIYRTTHQYSHWNTVACRITDIDFTNEIYDLEDDNEKEYLDITSKIEELGEQLERAIIEDAQQLMRKIYDELEKEYEYLTSDEQIAETIEINEHYFDERGNMIPHSFLV